MKKVIVAGGAGILGRAVVDELIECGVDVAVVDAAAIPAGITRLAVGSVDLADEAVVEKVYSDLVTGLGGLDGLVNIAGGFTWELIGQGSIKTFDAMYRMNLRTAAVSCRAALRHFSRGAAIVNVGAAAALNTAAGMAPYAASKAGVRALTEGLAAETLSSGIRVNAVLPTIIDTPRNRDDMPDADHTAWVKPKSAAKVIRFLISPDAAAVTGASLTLSSGA